MQTLIRAFFVILGILVPQMVLAAGAMHKVAIHVDENDPHVMHMALNNVKNLDAYYDAKGETVEIELVAYAGGLTMLRDDKSPVKDRITAMNMDMPNLTFSVCANTINGVTKREGHEVPLISGTRVVPSGIVRLMELQEQGYAYIRP